MLVQINEETSLNVGEKLFDKHPNVSKASKVVVTKLTKNFIFAKYVGSPDMEPMKYRRDGSLASDEYKRCRLFQIA